jgi:hypothetical protein
MSADGKKIFGFREWKPTRVFGSVMPSEPVAFQEGLTKAEIEDRELVKEAVAIKNPWAGKSRRLYRRDRRRRGLRKRI